MRAPHTAFREDVAALLQHVAPTVVGEKGRAEHGRHPRFAWITTGAPAVEAKRKAPLMNGGAARYSGADAYSWTVEAWGADEDSAFLMRLALISAIREIAGAAFKLGGTRIGEPPLNDDGYAIEIDIVVEMAAPDVKLPIEPLPTLNGLPDLSALEADTLEEVTLEEVIADPTEAASGDGLLHADEEENEA